MKSFYEFHKLLEAEGMIPPPPPSGDSSGGAAQGAGQSSAPSGGQAANMANPSQAQIPPTGNTSPPVPDPKTQIKDELKTTLQKFLRDKFEPFMQKQNMNPQMAKEFMTVVIGEIMDEFGMKSQQVMQAAKGAINTGNEMKETPQAPTASS